jgi:pimeloyl-ACP methyl ester carboxylesterase
MSKPHIVLVPGAWHAPFYMEALISKLEGLGYTIHARQMPAVGNPSPPKDLSEDIAALRSMVEEAISPNGNDVVVICHSWGGFVTGNGLVGLSRKEREAEGKKGGVVSLGYMTAFMISEGETLLGATGNIEASWVEVQVRKQSHTHSHTHAHIHS